jgi:hypothetical protein
MKSGAQRRWSPLPLRLKHLKVHGSLITAPARTVFNRPRQPGVWLYLILALSRLLVLSRPLAARCSLYSQIQSSEVRYETPCW